MKSACRELDRRLSRSGLLTVETLSTNPSSATIDRAPAFPSWQEWLLFIVQIVIVAGVEVSDDLLRGKVFPRDVAETQANAERVVQFEASHNFWVEPAIQRFFEQTHHFLDLSMTWQQVVPLANSLYGIAHGLVTALVAAWLYWRRPKDFAFVRNIFLFSTALSVAVYNAFPVAPPRLATGLRYEGKPFHFVDTVFVGGGVNLSFDRYAAMPSLHVVWALIAGATLVILARPPIIRAIGVLHPVLICTAVLITANHYIADCLGAMAVVVIAYGLALVVSRWQAVALLGARHAGKPDAATNVRTIPETTVLRAIPTALTNVPDREHPPEGA
jgi:hypothetical protein